MAECVNVLSAFRIELPSTNFSPGLQLVEAWLLLSLGRGSAFWRDDKRPWIIQRELSAAPGFAWNNMLSRVHLCAHWKIFNSGINFAGRKMWLFGIVTGRRCSEISKFV